MKEKFKIEREKLEKIVNQYEIDIKGKNKKEKEKIKEQYTELLIALEQTLYEKQFKKNL